MKFSLEELFSKRHFDNETSLNLFVAFIGFTLNLGLVSLKLFLAHLSESLAVTASAIDSGTDCLASLLLFAGLKLSTKKSPKFPLGLYKVENVISVILAFFIFFAGYEIARQMLTQDLRHPNISLAIIGMMAGGTLMTLLFALFALAIGRKTESPTLIAEGRHRQVDVITSCVVLTSIILNYLGFHFHVLHISIDKLAAGFVLIFIAYAGWELLNDGMRVLLDASIDYDTLEKIRKIIIKVPAVSKINYLAGRNAGRFRFLQTSIELRTKDLHKAHNISHQIESDIREQIPHVESVLIHYEPKSSQGHQLTVPLQKDCQTLSFHLGNASYFAFIHFNNQTRQVTQEQILENPFEDLEKGEGKGISVAEWLVNHHIDEIILSDKLQLKGPEYVFSNANVRISYLPVNSLQEIIDTYL
ncbi:MAG TPA: cation diffusion facilitator family transporter [Desulfohalobiaceae bacterium]|nr:cation diffusion facilitator family transporter [Desulfohalobiaceae bacterium]